MLTLIQNLQMIGIFLIIVLIYLNSVRNWLCLGIPPKQSAMNNERLFVFMLFRGVKGTFFYPPLAPPRGVSSLHPYLFCVQINVGAVIRTVFLLDEDGDLCPVVKDFTK